MFCTVSQQLLSYLRQHITQALDELSPRPLKDIWAHDTHIRAQATEVLARRSLQDATASVAVDAEPASDSSGINLADTDLSDTIFVWFVVVGVAWCVYHGCKPGGCCRRSSATAGHQHAHLQTEGTHHMIVGLPTESGPGQQQWVPQMNHAPAGVAVTHVRVGHPLRLATHNPANRFQRPPRVPVEAPSELYRVGSHRWSVTPDKEAHAVANQEASAALCDGSDGIDHYHSAPTEAEGSSMFLPPPIPSRVQEASNNAAEDTSTAPRLTQVSETAAHNTQSNEGVLRNEALAAGRGDSATLGSDKECVICYDGLADHVMMPCGHGGFCGKCATDMCTGHAAPYTAEGGHVCPVCRAPVDSVVKVSLGTKMGDRSRALCTLVVDHEAPPPQEPQVQGPQQVYDAQELHRRMMLHFMHENSNAVHPAHIVVRPANAVGYYPTHAHFSPPGYPPPM